MKERIYVGVDNGITGAIGIIFPKGKYYLYSMPSKSEQNYTKKKQVISRVDYSELEKIFLPLKNKNVIVVMERPMVNPLRFKSSTSALRALESLLICIESFGFPRMYCDSKDWQSVLLPVSIKKKTKKKDNRLKKREKIVKKKKEEDKAKLKKESLDIAKRLFPTIDYSKFKDGDAILIAEWARRQNF